MPKYQKRFKGKGTRKAKPQPRWKQIMKIGKELFPSIGGPLGYAIKGVNMMKNLINTEVKYVDSTPLNGTVGTGTTGVPLTAMAQGLTDTTRVGNSVLCKALLIRMLCYVNVTAAQNVIRVVIGIDKDNAKGTAPTTAELLDGGTYLNAVNKANSDRFVILRDMLVEVNTGGKTTQVDKIFIPLDRLHIKFDGTDGTQASLAENHIYMWAVSDNGTNSPTLLVQSRFTFYDN